MRSWLRPIFTLAALLLVLVVVGAAVLGVIERHLEQHRHDATAPEFGMEPVQGAEAHARREAEQGGGGGHASFFATASLSDAVRRRRTEWEPRQ